MRTAIGHINLENTQRQANGGNGILIPYQRQVWRPPAEIMPDLPNGFAVNLACWTEDDGVRHWVFEDQLTGDRSLDTALGEAFLGGLAIARQTQGLDTDVVNTYRGMCLLYSYRQCFHAFLSRRFDCSRDLFITPGGRDHDGQSRPPRTVLDVAAPGMSVTDFWRYAGDCAGRLGIESPSTPQLIQTGLWAMADSDPLVLDPSEVPKLIRRSLFDLDMTDADLAQAADHAMVPHLLKWIHSRLGDSESEFKRKFLDQIRKIARKANITPNEAREVVQALTWQAYRYVGDCIHVQMNNIHHTLNAVAPLTGGEQVLYRRTFLRQEVFGGLPWLVLRERTAEIQPEWRRALQDPDCSINAPAIHRRLQIYALMSSARREADNQLKRKTTRRGEVGQHSFDENRDAPAMDSARESSVDQVAGILESLGIQCPSCASTAIQLRGHSNARAAEFILQLVCSICSHRFDHQSTGQQLRLIATL